MSFTAFGRSSSTAAELPPAYSESTSLTASSGISNFHQRSISFAGLRTSQSQAQSRSQATAGPSQGRFLPDDSDVQEDATPDYAQLSSSTRADDDPHVLTSTGHRNDAVISDQAPEQPPNYTHFDEQARVFSIGDGGSVINIVNSSRVEKPRYQLRQHLSKSGRLWRLQIRRLLPSESRRLSMSSSNVEFDVDTMLYEAENLAALYAIRNRLEVQIKGRKAGTLPGHIELSEKGRDGWEFKHCTRPAHKHWSSEKTQKQIHRWGYKADMEVEKASLFTCRGIGRDGNAEWTWKDELTDVIKTLAVEMNGELVFQLQVADKVKDALVTCWAVKHWAAGSLSGRPPDVKLSRWLTIG